MIQIGESDNGVIEFLFFLNFWFWPSIVDFTFNNRFFHIIDLFVPPQLLVCVEELVLRFLDIDYCVIKIQKFCCFYRDHRLVLYILCFLLICLLICLFMRTACVHVGTLLCNNWWRVLLLGALNLFSGSGESERIHIMIRGYGFQLSSSFTFYIAISFSFVSWPRIANILLILLIAGLITSWFGDCHFGHIIIFTILTCFLKGDVVHEQELKELCFVIII